MGFITGSREEERNWNMVSTEQRYQYQEDKCHKELNVISDVAISESCRFIEGYQRLQRKVSRICFTSLCLTAYDEDAPCVLNDESHE